MSKTVTLTEERLQELFELTIAKTKAVLNQEAPNAVISNSNVYITNNYGDTYEEDKEQAPQPEKAPAARSSVMRIRPELLQLVVNAELKMQALEAINEEIFNVDPKAALVDRFAHLQHRLKGDTSVENIQDAFLWVTIQLALAAKYSGVFDDAN